ncbi:MAG: sigma-54-dependent transcriptional regulator [Sphaerochaetaceae bacterium]
MQGTVLIVDDNVRIYESLKPNFTHLGYDTLHAVNSSSTLAAIKEHSIDVVLMDIMLGDENGIDILQHIKLLDKNLPVIMITGFASIDTAIESMRQGAYDYVRKPLEFDRLYKIIENAVKVRFLSNENQQLKTQVKELKPKIFIENDRMLHLLEHSRKLALSEMPILILGENGSGKEVVADYIHEQSSRSTQPMHKTNCAAFTESLLDNELFGHEKGAYTGANEEFKGVFERANGGILFLDEIGDMPLTIQAKILRVLQNNEIRRIGGTKTKKIDVRFIAATNKDLEELMNEGLFRQDLYYRLNAAIIEVPPLRERKEDIEPMAKFFLHEFSKAMDKEVTSIDREVLSLFYEHPWPGNVRELKNAINYAVSITSSNSIRLEDIPPKIIGDVTEPILHHGLNIRERMEKTLIIKTLDETNFNKTQAAEILKMSRKTLYAKMNKYGIEF